jgi:small redox-active disulfide protein 2
MKIQILGSGCQKCKRLLANTEQAVVEAGITAEIEKIEDMKEIMKFRILSTPGLAIDGVVKSAGRVLSADEIKKFLKA